jgi:hypothetical protein
MARFILTIRTFWGERTYKYDMFRRTISYKRHVVIRFEVCALALRAKAGTYLHYATLPAVEIATAIYQAINLGVNNNSQYLFQKFPFS